jgi:hypothetical protein
MILNLLPVKGANAYGYGYYGYATTYTQDDPGTSKKKNRARA